MNHARVRSVLASSHRVTLAVRAGSAALVATALLVLFVLAPYLAAESHVGHAHPEGAPEHVHALQTVVTSLAATDARPCEHAGRGVAHEPAACATPPARQHGYGLPDPRAPPAAFV